MAITCPICGKRFENTRALGSHVTYKHKRAKEIMDITTTTPPQLEQDPEILELRREYEIKRLKRAIRAMDEKPTLMEANEKLRSLDQRLSRVEEDMRKIVKWIELFKNYNVSHILLLYTIFSAHIREKEELLLAFKGLYSNFDWSMLRKAPKIRFN